MIIVDERNFIKKALEDQGLNLFDYYDGHQLISVKDFTELDLKRRAEVVLIDVVSILARPKLFEPFKALLNTFYGVIFFYEEGNEGAAKWLEEQTAFLPKIIGAFSLPMTELRWNILSNQLQFFWTMIQEQKQLQKHMVEFSDELNQVLLNAESEMGRAKKIHEALVPKRSEEIKGVQFFNKYASGEGSGGEFYDLIQGQGKVYQVLVSSESYLISSSLIGLLNQHKQKNFDPQNFLQEAEADIATINGSKKKVAKVGVTVLELDLSQLTLLVWGQNNTELYSQSKGKIEVSTDRPIPLERGEKLIVFSSGFLFNWMESKKKQDIYAFIKNHQGLNPHELLTEFFFQVRQDGDSEFLKKDATVVMMEVNRHGMHQV